MSSCLIFFAFCRIIFRFFSAGSLVPRLWVWGPPATADFPGAGAGPSPGLCFFVLIKRPGWPVGTVVGVGSLGFLRGVYTLGSLGSGHSVRTPTGDLSEGLLFKQQLRAEMLGRNPWQVVNRGMFLRKNWFPVSERLAAPA